MVEAQLGDESQVMDVIDDKLENIKKNFENFKNLINHRFDKSQELVSQLVKLQMENRQKELTHARKASKQFKKNARKVLNTENLKKVPEVLKNAVL